VKNLSRQMFLVLIVSVIYVITGSVAAGWLGILPLIIAIFLPRILKITLFLYIVLAALNVFLLLYVAENSSFLDDLLNVIGLPYGSNELALFYAAKTWGFGIAGFMTFVGYHNYKTEMLEQRDETKVGS
jgi:hypothetical protein